MFEVDFFHRDIEIPFLSLHSSKKIVNYGRNWFDFFIEDDQISLILISKFSYEKDLIIQYIDSNEIFGFLLSSSCWDKDIFLEDKDRESFNKKNISILIHIEKNKSEEDSIAKSMRSLESKIKKDMSLIEYDLFLKNKEQYIDKSYSRSFFTLLKNGSISNVDGLFFSDDFNPDFSLHNMIFERKY